MSRLSPYERYLKDERRKARRKMDEATLQSIISQRVSATVARIIDATGKGPKDLIIGSGARGLKELAEIDTTYGPIAHQHDPKTPEESFYVRVKEEEPREPKNMGDGFIGYPLTHGITSEKKT